MKTHCSGVWELYTLPTNFSVSLNPVKNEKSYLIRLYTNIFVSFLFEVQYNNVSESPLQIFEN